MASEGEPTPIYRFNSRWSSAIPMSPIRSLQSRQSTDYQPVAVDIARDGQHTVPLLRKQNEGTEEDSRTGDSSHSLPENYHDVAPFTVETISEAFDERSKETDHPHCDETEGQNEPSELIDPFSDPLFELFSVQPEDYALDAKEPINEFPSSKLPVHSRLPVRDGGHLQAKSFTEAPRRKQYIYQFWVAAAASVVFAIPLPIFFVVQRSTSNNQQDAASGVVRGARSYCDVVNSGRPDGIQGLLAVDAAYGNMTFALAKLIDIVWDICVGRGYQLMFLFISYRVFTDCLLLIMESATVPYDLYTNIGFDRPSLFTLLPVVRFAYCGSVWRHKCLMIWLVFSIFWTALLPTFLSAMTGYGKDNRMISGRGISTWTNVDAVPNNNTLAVLLSKAVVADSGYVYNQEYLDEENFRGAQVGYSATVCMTNEGDPYPFVITRSQSAATANYGDTGSGSRKLGGCPELFIDGAY